MLLSTLTIILGYCIATFVHEGSHWVVAYFGGAEIVSFKPYPHIVGGHIYFGRMSFTGYWPTTMFWLAPVIANSLVAALFLLLYAFGIFSFLLLAACSFGDVVFWFYGYFFGSARTDGKRLRALQ